MRLALALTLLATPLIAEDFYAAAPVVAATVYADGATVTRVANVDLPAGDHRVLMPIGTGMFTSFSLPRISTSDGVAITATKFIPEMNVSPELWFSTAQRALRTQIESLEGDIRNQLDEVGEATNANEARMAERTFLSVIRPPESGTSPEDLTILAALVRDQTLASLAASAEGNRLIRGMQETLTELRHDLKVVQNDFDRLTPSQSEDAMLVLDVHVDQPTSATFTQTGREQAIWFPTYDLFLTTGDRSDLIVERNFSVLVEDGSFWQNIDLTLSTILPDGQLAPWEPRPNKAGIYVPAASEIMNSRDLARVTAPMVEPVVVIEEAAMGLPDVSVDGVAVEYIYPQKVTISQGEFIQLAHDRITFPVTSEIHASPRRDDTAFFMAVLENTSAEPLLPGTVRFHRDGHFMGEGEIELIPAGGSATLAFGPVEGLRLDHVIARNQTGDTGVFTRANTRSQQISFSVENLTGEPQEVKVFYPLVFSEQEDLEIDLNITPGPDEVDIDDKRGVSMWLMNLAAGEAQSVTIDARLDWPDGQELRWAP